MKTLKLLLCFLLFTFTFHFIYGQNWLWTANAYTRTPDNPQCPIVTDKSGNAYVTVDAQQSTLTIGNTTLTGKYGVTYFAKYSPSGAVVWAKQLTGSISTSSIATDKSGNFYIGGNFGDSIKIGSFTLVSPFNNGVFLAKFDSNGNALWAKQCQTSSRACYVGIGFASTDMLNNVFITGDFEDTVSFGSFTLTMLNNSHGNNRAVFLVKYDSNGNVLWAEQSKTPSVANFGGSSYSVATDNAGNSYITGGFLDTLSFGSYPLTGGGVFLVKYAPSGNVVWAEQTVGGEGNANSVITDGTNSYIAGDFEDNVQFGSHTLSSPGAFSIFIAKYDVNGHVSWVQQSSQDWTGNGLAADAYNHIYFTGATFQGRYTNQVSFGNFRLINSLIQNASFIMEMDTTGNILCGSMLNNPGSEASTGIASDPLGDHIYISSIFLDTLFYNGDTVLGTPGGFSSFVARWQSCTLTNGVASVLSPNSGVSVYPNPSKGVFQLKITNEELSEGIPLGGINNIVEVYNVLGEKVYSNYQITNPDSYRESNYQIDLSSQPNGIYLYRVIADNGSLVGDGKLVIEK